MNPCLELANNDTLGEYRFRAFIATHIERLSPAPGQFYGYKGRVRYMNGRKEIYETNITDPIRVFFVPDGQQRSGFKWEPVLFRKMHKVEWLFE